MIHDGRVLGLPLADYANTQAAVEALSDLEAGMTAWASDVEAWGYYDGADWQWFDEPGDYLTWAEHMAIGDGAPHHAAVTLGVGSDPALSLAGQELTLAKASETQTGVVELATVVEVKTGADTERAVTAAGVAGIITLATPASDGKLTKAGAGVLTLSAADAYTLTVPATGTTALGAGTLTAATVNDVTGATHTHAITVSSNPGATASILASDATGYLQLTGFGVGATAPTPLIPAIVTATFTPGAGVTNSQALRVVSALSPSIDSAAISRGSYYLVTFSGNFDADKIVGLSAQTYVAGNAGADIITAIGSEIDISQDLSSDITNLYGIKVIAGQQVNSTATSTIGTVCGARIETTSAGLGVATMTYGLLVSVGGSARTPTVYGGRIGVSTVGTTVAYGLRIDPITGASFANYALAVGAGLTTFADQIALTGSGDRQQLIVTGYTTQAVATPVAQITRNDAAAGVSAMLGLTALGSGANGDGGAVYLRGKTSTTAARDMARFSWLWVDATHASRKARSIWSVWDTAEREGVRIEASGAAPMLGFYGGAAVVRGAALTAQLTTITHTAPGTPDYAIQDMVDVSLGAGWAFADHDEANTVLSVIANLQTRVAEIENRLSSAAGVNLFA